jgi:hypothetical protein
MRTRRFTKPAYKTSPDEERAGLQNRPTKQAQMKNAPVYKTGLQNKPR